MKRVVIGALGSEASALLRVLAQSEGTHRAGTEGPPASFRLPEGTIATWVQIPDSIRSSEQVVAGVSAVDLILLSLTTEGSVNRQIPAVLEVLSLLGVQQGVIALTSEGRLRREQVLELEEVVQRALQGTPVAAAPIVPVTKGRDRGNGALRRALLSAASRVSGRDIGLPARLFIDSVAQRSENEANVSGILSAGTLRAGDVVVVMPTNTTARVRRVQAYGHDVGEALAGDWVSVCLAADEKLHVEPGAQLAAPCTVEATTAFDAVIRVHRDPPLSTQDQRSVHLWIGGVRRVGTLSLSGRQRQLNAGEQGYARFCSDIPFACARGDRYILWDDAAARAHGGGTVLDPAPSQEGAWPDVSILNARETGTGPDRLEDLLLRQPTGVPRREALVRAQLSATEAEAARTVLQERGRLQVLPPDHWIHSAHVETLRVRVCVALERYHGRFPQRPGMPADALRAVVRQDLPLPVFRRLLDLWRKQGHLALDGTVVRLASFQPVLNARQSALMERIAAFYAQCGIETPTVEQVSRAVKAPPDAVLALLTAGVERGMFVRVADGVFFDRSTLEGLKDLVHRTICERGAITVGELRDMTGSSRRYALQALEFFDAIGFTRREGDRRVLGTPPH
ncbi:MAG: SelB C-terminal domain-containing protein [Chloroherpetonaceae bacterium]|nr:SelB C-terminal domain-containing protein [Chthonomonadaceae bacterium]MDW8208457.1 SelB C-terminal domain-containing protein [Chloroherpetonaceae bacterium]